MSLLFDYDQRTAWKHQPIRGFFHTADGLRNKVDESGGYVRFPGTTAVFRADKTCCQAIQLIQRALGSRLEDTGMLAYPLPASTIHMTLHDLISPEKCACDPGNREQYEKEMADSLDRAAKAAADIQRDFAGRKIIMRADRIVNMVAKSLVLLLRPQTEEDFALLLEMYRRFDPIVSLPYPLTPHITLAYFRPGPLDGDRLGAAVDLAQINPDETLAFDFCPEGLTAQVFRDMASYQDVPEKICFCCDGGMNRSVLAAHILNHQARERGLPVVAEARSAYENTQGRPIPDQVINTLKSYGIDTDGACRSARYLQTKEAAFFSHFAPMTAGAMDRVSWLGLPEERARGLGRYFYGVRDPEYGEITHEQAFRELWDRTEQYLDAFEIAYGKYLKSADM